MHSFLVFPSHRRYFDHLVNVCGKLHNNCGSKALPAASIGVITMKRSYFFENNAGEYGEFEQGDRFFLFRSSVKRVEEALLFGGLFPTEEIQKECEWEGKPYRTHIVRIDESLSEDMKRKMSGLSLEAERTENTWMLWESLSQHLLSLLEAGEPLKERGN